MINIFFKNKTHNDVQSVGSPGPPPPIYLPALII